MRITIIGFYLFYVIETWSDVWSSALLSKVHFTLPLKGFELQITEQCSQPIVYLFFSFTQIGKTLTITACQLKLNEVDLYVGQKRTKDTETEQSIKFTLEI